MNMKKIEEVMATYGLVIRAIPNKKVSIYETKHEKSYPDGKIVYLEKFKREMLVIESVPTHCGKFLIEQQRNTDRMVSFSGKKYFDSFQDAIEFWLEKCEREESLNYYLVIDTLSKKPIASTFDIKEIHKENSSVAFVKCNRDEYLNFDGSKDNIPLNWYERKEYSFSELI